MNRADCGNRKALPAGFAALLRQPFKSSSTKLFYSINNSFLLKIMEIMAITN
jgi:hypothetical protein